MLSFLFAFGVFSSLFLLLFLSISAGRRFGKWQVKHDKSHKLRVVNVAEGALFGLLGLLVAFTFTGSYERFEGRKALIIEEANSIDAAYLRIGLLAPSVQEAMRKSFREYIDSRLETPVMLPSIRGADGKFPVIWQLRDKIWDESLAACKITGNTAVTELFIISVNKMFEAASTRYGVSQVHPPLVIYVLLILLAVLSSLLAGYSTSKSRVSHSIHTLSYVAITALILYVTMDLEFPRLGLIRVDTFDHVMVEVRNTMN